MAIKFLSSENIAGDIDVTLSKNGITYLAVTNTNTGASANARVQVVGESAQIDIIATSVGYTGVSGWADSGVISTDSAASGGLILNSVAGIVKLQTSQTTALTIDSSQNATFEGTIIAGPITSSASITASGNSNDFGNTTITALSATSGTFSASVTAAGNSNSFGNTTIGTITSGNISTQGMITVTQNDIGTGESVGLRIIRSGGAQIWNITSGMTGIDNTTFNVRNSTSNTNVFGIDATSNSATFIGDLGVGGVNKARFKSDGTNTYVDAIPASSSIIFRNSGAVESVRITGSGDIWQLNGANSTGSFAPWDVSYPDSGICINVPAGSSRYLSFADSQTPSYGGGLRYFEASNFTEIYSKLAGAYTTHLRVDRASPYTTWLNPDISGNTGNVGIGISTAPLAKLHLEGTGDMIRVVKNANTYGPQMDLILNQTSPSNGDIAAYINMGAKDNSGNAKYWGSIRAVVDNIFTEIGGFEFYTRAATDFNKRLKISAQGKVIVYQKDNVSGFYLDGANTRFYANGGGGTDYRGIECNSSGMWSWGETGTYNYFAKPVGIGTTLSNEKLEVAGNIRIDSRSKAGSGEIDNITFTKDRADAATGTYEMGAIRSFTTNGYSGGMTFYCGRHTGGGGYALISTMTIGHTTEIGLANVGIGTTVPAYKLDVAGTIRATGDVIAYSDARVKDNVKTIDNALEKVTKLRGVEFNKIGEDKKSIGVIAQEIEEIIPEVVHQDKDGMKSVAYGNITGVLIEAIKELKAEVEELKKQIK